MNRMAIVGAVLTLVVSPVLAGSEPAAPNPIDRLPFAPGERLVFHLRWGIVPAGEATLEVLPPQRIDGQLSHHFVLTARTNSVVDLIYKVRQRIDAYCDLAVTRSLLYREVHTVHNTRRDATIRFDWERKEARYVNLGKAEPPITLSDGTFDPLSAFYYSRTIDPSQSRLLERPVTDGKKCVIGRATVVRRETIRVQGQPYDTYLVEPELKEVKGVFEKDKSAKIQVWVTADARKIPVRLKSKVAIGSFVGDLVAVEGLASKAGGNRVARR